jgi:hypothetical protein
MGFPPAWLMAVVVQLAAATDWPLDIPSLWPTLE